MLKIPHILFIVLLFVSTTTTLSSSISNDHHIQDLTGTTTAKFSFQTSLWNLTGLFVSANTSICNSQLILGGPNILKYGAILTRKYTELPPHNILYFEIGLVLIDKFQYTDSFQIKLDNFIIPGGANLAKFTPHLETNLCGQSQYPDTAEGTLLGSIPHNTETLTLEFISKVISQGAVGIKNINILLSNNSEISTPSSCFRLYDNKLTNIEGECKSIKGKYINENPCDPSCSNCFGPSSNECFSCNPGFFFNGIQCTSESIALDRMLSSVTTEDLDSMDKVIDAINVFGEMSSVGILLSSLTITGNPSAIAIINMVKMIQSIRYIDIEYPTKLQYLLYKQDQSSISLNFGVEFSEESKEEDFSEYPIPEIFQTYGLTSNFIVNYWSGLFTIMMACITIITAMFCVWLFSNTQLFCIISRKILEIMRWNFFLIILFSNIDGIGVPASLDLRTIHFDSSLSIFGTALAIIFNLGIPAIIVAIPFIIMALRRSRAKVWNITGVPIRGGIIQVSDSEYKTLQQRLRTCKIFYKNLRDTSLFHQLALFFMLARAYLFHIIVGYLFANPLVQSEILSLLSLFFSTLWSLFSC